MEILTELKEHLELNATANVYRNIPANFDIVNGKYLYAIDYEKVKEYHLTEAKRNIELIKQRIENRKQFTNILVGDYIHYLDGRIERTTYIWEDSAQAGGGSGSYYMSKSGYGSYSGGLNSGLPLNKLKATNDFKPALFWLFSEDWSGGSRGVYFYCPVRIWQEIE
jgi:hypothetical protein